MLKKIIKPLLIISVPVLLVCSGKNQQTLSGGYVENQNLALAFTLPCDAEKTSDTLTMATAVISGNDMDSIFANLQVESCKITGLISNIPAGDSRKIDINVFDKKNQVVYIGNSACFDIIPGKTIDVIIKLRSQTGSVNITGIICDSSETQETTVEFTPDQNTLALYHFNEDSGSVLYDAMQQWPGVLKSGTRVSGYKGNAVKFSYGNSARFDTIIPTKTQSGTIELFFKFDNTPKTDSVYLLFGSDGSRCNIYYNNGYLVFLKNHDDLFKSVEYPVSIETDRWYHVAGTWGCKGMRLFINDSLVVNNTDTTYYQSSYRSTEENVFKIGDKTYCCMNGGGIGILRPISVEAIIDEVRISNIQRY